MASETDLNAAAELVLLYQATDLYSCWTHCAFALLLYDYILTFRHEVRFVWGRKISGATALFLVNRYFIILPYLLGVVMQFPIQSKACPGIGRFVAVLEFLPYIIWATFSALRAYALSGRTTAIGIVIFILSLVPVGVNAYYFSTFSYINLDAPLNCNELSDITPQLSKNLTIVSRATLMAADVLVIAVTWANTYGLRKASRDARISTSFSTILLRDGTIYFVVLVAMNAVQMMLNAVKVSRGVAFVTHRWISNKHPPQPSNMIAQASYVTILEEPITSILVSRFILNLREVDHRGANGGGGSDTLLSSAGTGSSFVVGHPRDAASTMRFASVASTVDVLGAPLAHESDEETFGEEDNAEGWGADPEKAVGGGDAPAGSEGGMV
ncbi:uncharacterized protein TRAVEDRAFT_20676 [Trametes versicolor FP-101664 SS1]|uniref:uncharacterized protein n=1 Tax=Trametes versicolor (strain FP-101664) TaxID=717944 RepID=UPI0004622585|nr:uncharacterized protein TRAVEDRAFT_20676 [Trametes versicolor FP-101664 SS1]EIW58770.1 hypothetical protein TRAVEDRAFT_20676 [Trametes versicolor FP-101664 SS1]